jgi:hypothetical protein
MPALASFGKSQVTGLAADELACKPGCLGSDSLTSDFLRIMALTCGNTLTAGHRQVPGMSGFSRTYGGLLKFSRTIRGPSGPQMWSEGALQTDELGRSLSTDLAEFLRLGGPPREMTNELGLVEPEGQRLLARRASVGARQEVGAQ